MEFYETEEGRLGLRQISAPLAELLRQIPKIGGVESEAAEARLYPHPSGDEAEDRLRADWKAYVQPGLHELFQSARQVVDADLRGLREEDGSFSIEFSVKHAEAWINALNQARLAIAAVYGFDEGDISRPWPSQITTESELALVQIDIYADIQHWLVEMLE